MGRPILSAKLLACHAALAEKKKAFMLHNPQHSFLSCFQNSSQAPLTRGSYLFHRNTRQTLDPWQVCWVCAAVTNWGKNGRPLCCGLEYFWATHRWWLLATRPHKSGWWHLWHSIAFRQASRTTFFSCCRLQEGPRNHSIDFEQV